MCAMLHGYHFITGSHLILVQNGEGEGEKDEDGKAAKARRRPRPEPLFIPSPKTGTFIAPSVYSNITPYQSHLRSPVRLADNPIALPPYTPPPILSPVREGSGLYFSTFMSSGVANAPGLPPPPLGLGPPATPKSASRSLLRSSECLSSLLKSYGTLWNTVLCFSFVPDDRDNRHSFMHVNISLFPE